MEIVVKKGGVLWWKKFHFTFVAENNKILCRSRKMQSLDEIFYWLDKVKRAFAESNGLKIDIVIKEGEDQPYYFHIVNIYSEDEEILLWSETYHNRKDCNDTADLIKKQIKDAKVVLL